MQTGSDRRGSTPPPARFPRGRRVALRALRLLAVSYLVILLLAMIFEESLIFFPSRFPEGDWDPRGLSVEDAWFEAADGTRLHGWYVEHPEPRAVVLFCHGNAGNVSHRADQIRELVERVGVSVLCFDYRGYGRSQGRPNEPGVLADGRAARDWLAQRTGVDPAEIVLLGRSLGGAVAVELAASQGARALVLESTFSSIADVAARYYRWLPVRWLLRTRLDSRAKIPRYHGPLFQSHGDADSLIPYSLGQRLYQAANPPKQFFRIPGGDHNELPPREYYDALRDFLERLPDAK